MEPVAGRVEDVIGIVLGYRERAAGREAAAGFAPGSACVVGDRQRWAAVEDLDGIFNRAQTAGARITSPIDNRPWGERSFYCSDLDGNRLCFVDDSTLFLGRGADWS